MGGESGDSCALQRQRGGQQSLQGGTEDGDDEREAREVTVTTTATRPKMTTKYKAGGV